MINDDKLRNVRVYWLESNKEEGAHWKKLGLIAIDGANDQSKLTGFLVNTWLILSLSF